MSTKIRILLHTIIILLSILLAVFYFTNSRTFAAICFILIGLLNLVALVLQWKQLKK